MLRFIALFGVDPSNLGRIDKASLPQQALMEMFIDGMTNRDTKICRSKEEPKDIEEWIGVTFNRDGEVIEIDWFRWGLEGTLNLEWLPSTVRQVRMFENNLTGSIHLETLPPSVKYLNFSDNEFSGEISLRHLPEGLEFLYLSGNQLSGPVDLTKLPACLQALYLYDNNFSGETDFSQLPASLTHLDVSNTQLSGEIHLKWDFKVEYSNVRIAIDESQA